MDAALLRTILENAAGFTADGGSFTVKESFEVSIHLAIDALDARLDKVRSVRVEHGYVAIVNGDKQATTYADAASVATVSVRESATGDKKRPGFA